MPPAPSSQRALDAILPLIAQGQAYEAHQKARTFASRYNKAGQYDTAIDVLFQSARELLKAGQQGSGTDLAGFLLDVYESKGEEVNDESRGRLTQLIALTGPGGSWRKTTIDKAVAWSTKHGPCPAGDQSLNHYIGELLYKEGEFEAAETHLLAAGQRDSARVLAQMMFDWSAAGAPPGLFALRGVIPYLQNGNILAARTFITSFVTSLLSARPSLRSSLEPAPLTIPRRDDAAGGSDSVEFTTDPVLNFAQLAVATCQRAHGEKNKTMREAWVRLCGTYGAKGGVMASREVRAALQDISTLYFAIPPPRTAPVNPFGDIMSSLFGGPPSGAAQPARRVLSPAPGSGASTPGLD
ncbi:hypothetical protein GLOTRDRAFT_62507 [Gloeophyllum trabeum ATCC 11539]|uniref:DUF410-domain-containing protein n=1 Tax=Gloeophyllum trabeum (strain ATCC 11539 / FP-39264 / Madison 617) TaxID=670483 RepID=S7RIB8_GLOTA|nr:uncharacterized protein GLOTRDRAFT_62507 [Gloeophyllum trabeum ATCC 11539]EPQ54035.1 hypothetical protein GLOTRDRAFT_62507 [Gloeophyllum trabeum ATCC 11539]